jgi:pimeloyl-ACP methyl ester carboxylesterase
MPERVGNSAVGGAASGQPQNFDFPLRGMVSRIAAMRRTLCSLIVFATLISPTTAQDVESPLGRLVDIGGRRMHLHCTGSGSPTVVIEAGASSFSIDFSLVQPGVSKTARVCSYDRAGSGWSDARPDVETPIRVIRDLRTLLDTAGEKGPFVMVGASRGGVFVRLFQAEYPTDVGGIVLIDPTAEDRLFVMFQGAVAALASLTPEQHRSTQPSASAVIPIPTRQPQTGAPFDRLPKQLYATRVALDRKLIASMPPTVSGEVVVESATGDYAMLSRLSAARKATPTLLGDLPVIVLSRGLNASPEQQAAHAEISRMSRNARHLVVADSYHEIHLSHPDVVVAAIGDVVAAVKAKAPLR